MNFLEFLGETGSIPWTYRGWLYIFSEVYRQDCRKRWLKAGPLYMLIDIILSISMMVLETLLAAYFLAKTI
jgi:hypothetical protein